MHVKEEYARLRTEGKQRTLVDIVSENPMRFIIYLAAAAAVIYHQTIHRPRGIVTTPMKPWILLDTVAAPIDAEELRLLQRDAEFSIRVGNYELMNSRARCSEEALAELTCARIANRLGARVLIGG